MTIGPATGVKRAEAPLPSAFSFASLAQFSFKQRFVIRVADLAFFLLISTLGRTVQFTVRGGERLSFEATGGTAPIYVIWHNRILLCTYYFRHRQIVVMTSQSFDGEYIARFVIRLGYGAARGSSTRGGVGALVEMIRLARQGFIGAFTIDGPKGPRYIAKPGAIMLAKKTGHAVLPFCITPKRYWQIKSWDGLQIPKPFTRALLSIGEPFFVEPDADEAAQQAYLDRLQTTLDGLTVEGEAWRLSD